MVLLECAGAVVAILCSVKDRMLEAHADGGWIKKSRLCRAEDSQLKLNRPTSIGFRVGAGVTPDAPHGPVRDQFSHTVRQ